MRVVTAPQSDGSAGAGLSDHSEAVDNAASSQDAIVETLPQLRAFARSLCGDATRADDLVQETVVKAWTNLDKFQHGTNIRAWLFTILRNQYYSELRKRRREVEDIDGVHAGRLSQLPNQLDRQILREFSEVIATLPDSQREALILTSAAGFSCEEAAEICDCAAGTIKSRVSRARARILQVLDVEDGGEFISDSVLQAAQSAGQSRSS